MRIIIPGILWCSQSFKFLNFNISKDCCTPYLVFEQMLMKSLNPVKLEHRSKIFSFWRKLYKLAVLWNKTKIHSINSHAENNPLNTEIMTISQNERLVMCDQNIEHQKESYLFKCSLKTEFCVKRFPTESWRRGCAIHAQQHLRERQWSNHSYRRGIRILLLTCSMRFCDYLRKCSYKSSLWIWGS